MQIIFGNYGDNTIALIQWAHANSLKVSVVSVETGWAALSWREQIERGQALAQGYGFETVSLKPTLSFQDLVRDRKSFPNLKFQWCATFLKALPFLAWLNQVDDRCEATILLGSRRADSRARIHLAEYVEESEHYDNRPLWFPLCHFSNQMRADLIQQAGFMPLNHRSLECDPCIHSQVQDLHRLEQNSVLQTLSLEQEIHATLFHKPLDELIATSKQDPVTCKSQVLEVFDMGCGSRYACGE
jgi:3'-phosphoadenosine 5'-phosphosulfate sulfotransferase (PAPS reductase)/FAD synthetase